MIDNHSNNLEKHDTPRPPTARRKITLTKMAHVRAELGRLYAEARHGDIDVADASKLGNLLAILAKIIENSEIEQRLTEVEKALGGK